MNETEKKVRELILRKIEALSGPNNWATDSLADCCKAHRDFAEGCEKFHACETLANMFPHIDSFATVGTTQNDN